MDAQKMGAFIAQCRKEKQMTQEQLAQRLQVTDKAVSRWERGVGFPDITTIEPLAQALGVEVLELMHAQRLKKPDNSNSKTEQAVHDILQLAQEQRRQERKKIALLLAGVLTALLLLLVLDVLDWQWEAILFTGLGVILPLFCAGGAPHRCGRPSSKELSRRHSTKRSPGRRKVYDDFQRQKPGDLRLSTGSPPEPQRH